MEKKVSKEIAKDDLDKWLDSKFIPATRRQDGDAEVIYNEVLNAVEEGIVTFNKENEVIFKLRVPIEMKDNIITELKFVHRITAGALQAKTSYVKQGDTQGALIAKIAALTGEVGGTIRCLDSVDHGLCAAIAFFY